ncbi:MAG: penicillin-binding protein 2, partial [Planctomycetota bacterium]
MNAARLAVVCGAGFSLVAIAVLLRIASLQIAPATSLEAWLRDHERTTSIEGRRGRILDRRGRPLAVTMPGRRIVIDPEEAREDPHRVIGVLAGELGINGNELGARLLRDLAVNERRRSVLEAMEPEASEPSLERLWERVVVRFSGAEDAAADHDAAGEVPRLRRYLPVEGPIPIERAERVLALGLPGVWAERRPVRVYPAGEDEALEDTLAGVVGLVNHAHDGALGVELAFDGSLEGEDGGLSSVRDARGRPLWLGPGGVASPEPGGEVRLSIDATIQRIAVEELRRGLDDADAAGGRVVVIDPATGEVLAMADLEREIDGLLEYPFVDAGIPPAERPEAPATLYARYRVLPADEGGERHPALARSRVVEDIYEPGSIFKPLVWATALAAGVTEQGETFPTGGDDYRTPYGRTIRDVTRRENLDWEGVLVHSSNVGMSIAADRLGDRTMQRVVRAFGFGERTGLGLAGESGGLTTPASRWNDYSRSSVSFGQEISATPAQMVRAFATLARTGRAAGTLPRLRLTADEGSGVEPLERVLPGWAAERTRFVLVRVAERMDGLMATKFDDVRAPRFSMFGKSGTAQIALTPPPGMVRPRGAIGYYPDQRISSFIAGAPVELPRLVVMVSIDDPGPDLLRSETHYGSHVAGPVVRRVVERDLGLRAGARKVRLDTQVGQA